ncbi:segregation and condensation protein B [Propionispira arboris]|uniref:Segregation and condensation protein B n=1 Tax=Propionispira arboris TaxID=84035 RepID=A0A1H6W3F6_9FIRM|nr:SMC-Scp complex subunit ScpB [Propionispira arboris]SEJ07042.1 segregation and condensation protein B [Propionispira arboris]
MFYANLKGHVEALLFINGDPVPAGQLAEILNVDKVNIEEIVAQLKEDMDTSERGLTIIKVAGGYQLCTKPELAAIVEKMAQVLDNKLSVPAMETLSIIAFKQPITKQEIENIRGVRVDRVLMKLIDRLLVKELGRKKVIGRPILYGTTEEFLKCFGLDNIEDLPLLPDAVYAE